jgi:DNA recombination protein RmuC
METLWVLVAAIVGVIAGSLLGFIAARKLFSRTDGGFAADALATAEAATNQLRVQLAESSTRATVLAEQVEQMNAQLAEYQQRELQEQKVLTELKPVSETLNKLEAKVIELEQQRTKQHSELSQQLRQSLESEERLAGTADKLASALAANQSRGVWGETQLRRIVEVAGMLKQVDFTEQHSVSGDDLRGRPDMVVHLPGDKHLAVDAKVPFNAYLEASEISLTSAPLELERRDVLLKKHAKALKDHVTALGGKAYWNGLSASPEFVIAFIPSESLLASALEADPGLLDYAFERKVALASPVSFWAILKAVAQSWRQDVLTEEAKTLFELSKELHQRLGTASNHLDAVGKNISKTVENYNKFVSSLETRVFPTARKISQLNGDSFTAQPALIETVPAALTAPEFSDDEKALEEASPSDQRDDQ